MTVTNIFSGFSGSATSTGGSLIEPNASSSGVVVGENDPSIRHCVTALIPFLPAPLALKHGPLLVTVETWTDESVVARLPCAALAGEGDSDTAALDDLATTIADFFSTMLKLEQQQERIAGPLKRDWDNILALVEMAGIPR